MQKFLDMWPDLVGFCPSECLQDTFTPGETKKTTTQNTLFTEQQERQS